MKKLCLISLILFIISKTVIGQTFVPYKNPALAIEERVLDLLSRMTPEEKFWQLFMIPGSVETGDESKYTSGIFGFQFSASSRGGGTAGQLLNYNSSESARELVRKINATQKYFIEKSRLGIPIIAFDEALHGIVREGGTVFPQSIALAATWDTVLMSQVADAIATETRMRGIRQILSPVVNIANDPRWGRVEETYGEDPFLSSEMGVAFVKAFEKKGIITTPKHFLANTGDGGRDSYPIHFNQRLLEEIYLPPFKAVIERGGARSIMTSYNSLDGRPASASSWLLRKKLKEEWKFHGFVISDAGAVGGANVLHFTTKDYPASGKDGVVNGLDVIFQTNYDHYKLFIPHFIDGSIDKKIIDDAVARVLRIKFELGLFENPYVKEEEITKFNNLRLHKEIAKKAALESIVLLKNSKKALPLKQSIRNIALIGTEARAARLGGYSGPGNNKVSIADGLKKQAGNNINIIYSPGVGIRHDEWKNVPSQYLSTEWNGNKQKGLKGDYYTNIDLKGNPKLTRIDNNLNFHWTFSAPAEGISNDLYSVRWTGKIKSPSSGKIRIGLSGNDGYRLYINDTLVIDNWKKQTYSTQLAERHFIKDKEYDIRVEFFEAVGNGKIGLIWDEGIRDTERADIQNAIAAAKKSDIAIIVAGIHEGEFQDRAFLGLPGSQETMIREIAAVGKPVIVILTGGSAITMNSWINKVDAILDVWYPGEEGGNAVADIVFGNYNPSGKLPITFPISEGQVPLVYNHKPTGRGDDYYDLTGLPLFPFGFGLSYTSFEYSDIELSRNNISEKDTTTVSFRIKNTGALKGDEVIQLYIRDELASVARPVMELKGFQRVSLSAGETKEISFQITHSMLSMLDKDLKTVVEPGDFRIMIGASSRDIRLKETLTIR